MRSFTAVLVIMLLAPVFFCLVARASDDPLADASWLRNPLFEGITTIDLLHKEDEEPPALEGPQNVHTLFRKVITLEAEPESATLYITGDDYYKFYLNGAFVVQGPELGYPFAHPYYKHELDPEALVKGSNALAAHAYYQGLRNRVWNSADNRSGFMLTLEVTYKNGASDTFSTDDTWRYHTLEAFASGFPTRRTIGYKTQFAEDIDLRKWPSGWRDTGYDDSGWETPLVDPQDHVFREQITPPLEVYRADPVETLKKDDGHYFYDFGHEIAGHTRIQITGPAGHRITVRHGEELEAPHTVRYDMRADCKYEEFPILAEGDNLIPFYDYRAFRYMEILDAPAEPEVWVDVRHHPFDPDAATLDTADTLVQGIWDICKRGVQMGSQGGFLDCPTREKGQYLGDAVIIARSHLWLTGDASLTKKCLVNFANSQRICPGIMAVAPSSFMQEIAEYSLQWPLMLAAHYRHTGDKVFLARMADDVFPGLYDYFAQYENDHGLLEGVDEKWVLVDWPKNLRDDYDYDYAQTRANTVLNAFYYGSLKTAAELLEELGRDATKYRAKAARIEEAFANMFVDPETGLYLDAPGSDHSALHANAIPLRFGLTAGADKDAMIALIREKGLHCGVYIASYLLEACFENGEPELAWQLITSKDTHSWHQMLEAGATTCMEAWGPEQKWNTSWCHPWSSSPIYLLAERVLGLSPARPGWRAIRFAPAAIEELPPLDFTFTIPAGTVRVTHDPEAGYTISAPAGIPVETGAPAGREIEVKRMASLTQDQLHKLDAADWKERVGGGLGVWVDVAAQRLYLLENDQVVWQAPCSTAAAGPGQTIDTHQTPLGWHAVAEKHGAKEPWGRVFKARQATDTVWQPAASTAEDLVLSRILWLEGLEPGFNQGHNEAGELVDSKRRYIYIHGTNEENRIGTPASHGCIRLLNDDVIAAFERISEGTPVLITQ